MPDKLFVKVEIDLPTDVFDRAEITVAAKKLKMSVATLVEETLPGATMTFGVDAERIPDAPKVRKPRKAKVVEPPMPKPEARKDEVETQAHTGRKKAA